MRPGPQCLRVPGRRLHDLRERQHRDRVRLRLRRTQRISARLYDKTAEMALKGTDWWELVWGDRHTPGAQVWRIEFEIGRAALSDLELFRPEAVLAAVPSLWRYCTGEWLTLALAELRTPTVPAGRSIRAGRPCSRRHSLTGPPSCASSGSASGPPPCASLMPALVGYLVAFAVLMGTTDFDVTLEALLGAAWPTTRSSAG